MLASIAETCYVLSLVAKQAAAVLDDLTGQVFDEKWSGDAGERTLGVHRRQRNRNANDWLPSSRLLDVSLAFRTLDGREGLRSGKHYRPAWRSLFEQNGSTRKSELDREVLQLITAMSPQSATGVVPASPIQLTLPRFSLFGLCRDIPRISGDRFCDPVALAVRSSETPCHRRRGKQPQSKRHAASSSRSITKKTEVGKCMRSARLQTALSRQARTSLSCRRR